MPRCIVTDLDRTLTGPDLALDARALQKVRDLRAHGIRVVVATGRTLDHLHAIGLHRETDGIVAENGAITCVPSHVILETTNPHFAARARAALGEHAARFHWGRVLGSGPREDAALAATLLGAARIPHTMEYNAEEVMLLPAGTDKGTGVSRCLQRLGIAPAETWGIGDGENDVRMLQAVGLAAVPLNAALAARGAADVLLTASHADAFLELADLALDAPRPDAHAAPEPHREEAAQPG